MIISYITTSIQQAEHLHSIPPPFTVRGPSSLGVADFFLQEPISAVGCVLGLELVKG